jgi:hypothetical protein
VAVGSAPTAAHEKPIARRPITTFFGLEQIIDDSPLFLMTPRDYYSCRTAGGALPRI